MRIEFADGKVREFEAEHPHDLECVISPPGFRKPLPVDLGSPLTPWAGEITEVRLGFSASGDPRHRMVMRTEGAKSPQTVLDEVRAKAQEWAGADCPGGNLVSRRTAGEVLLKIIGCG